MNKTLVSIESIEAEFDKRIIGLKEKAVEFQSEAMDVILPNFIKDHEEIKKFYRQQILSLLKEYGEEIIGEDEYPKNNEQGVNYLRTPERKARDELRQEQRTILQNKIKELNLKEV